MIAPSLPPMMLPGSGLSEIMVLQESQEQSRVQFEGGLEVAFEGSSDYRERDATAPNGGRSVRFSGNVVATYGPTTLKAAQLTIFPDAGQGTAEGGVLLEDPEGVLEAERIEFDWFDKTGSAFDARVRAGNVRLWAQQVEITPEVAAPDGAILQRARYDLFGVQVTLARSDNPAYSIHTPHLTLYPGDEGVARNIELELFGFRLGRQLGGYDYRFSLNPRSTGIKFPEIAERRGSGYGLNWSSRVLIGPNTDVAGSWSTFPGDLPQYGVQMSRSFLDLLETDTLVSVSSDLSEPFEHAYMDSILTKSPKDAFDFLGRERLSLGVGTAWNNSTAARPEDFTGVSKALEVAMDVSGTRGDLALFTNTRIQRIRINELTSWVDRASLRGSAVLRPYDLGSDFRLLVRADLFATQSADHTFAWTRASGALNYQPAPGLNLSAGYAAGENFGTPDFAFDPLPLEQSWNLRADYEVGPYTARFIRKYDARTGAHFSDEWELALVWEAFEPFVISRDFPSDFRFGVRLRIDDFLRNLQQRTAERRPDPG